MTRARTLAAVAATALAVACATTGADGQGDLDLPSAGVGPFRKLDVDEVLGIAPFVLDGRVARYRDPSAVLDGSDVLLFAVGHDEASGVDVIVRSRAHDGRSFHGTSADFGRSPRVVLAPDAPWEGRALAGPSVLRREADWLLYYAGEHGIGVARSTDGVVFRKEPGPVLGRATGAASGWETDPPHAPGAYLLADGRVRLLYASGAAIGEAESDDGLAFRRRDADPATPAIDPVLLPARSSPPGSLLPNEKAPFDTARVTDPCAVPRVTPAGRFHLRVLYTGLDASGASAIGFAARYGESGPLVRQPVPVYAVGQHERAPAFLALGARTFLYVQQDRRVDATTLYPAVAAGVAPANLDLGPPAPFPDAP